MWVEIVGGTDVIAGAGVRRRKGRRDWRPVPGRVMGCLRAVRGRVERGGTGVVVVGRCGDDAAAGAGVWRCAGHHETVDRPVELGEVGR